MNVIIIALLAASTTFMVLMVYYFLRYRSLKQWLAVAHAEQAEKISQLAEQHAYDMMLLRAELEPLRQYAHLPDAQAEAERIMHEARSQALFLKADAERYACESRQDIDLDVTYKTSERC